MVRHPRVVVVGGGLSGLATAWYLRRDHPDFEVVVHEGNDRLGGKIRTRELAGQPFDVGADAFLCRQPEFAELCVDLGLGDDLVAPLQAKVWLWLSQGLRPLPTGTTLGIPGDLEALEAAGVLSAEGLSRAQGEAWLGAPRLGPKEDPTIADFVAARFGPEVVDRLVDPLLSGIYAGDTARLGLRSAAPAIAALADVAVKTNSSMLEVARLRSATLVGDERPVFQTVKGGLGRVIDRLAQDLLVRTGTSVARLTRVAGRWHVDGEPTDAVVLAAPAWRTTQMIASSSPALASRLDRIPFAGATVVALAYPSSVTLPEGSGMLVPRGEGRLLKAATWSSRKWPHLAERDEVLLRCSMGRVDDGRHEMLSDEEAIERTRQELAEAMGLDLSLIHI